MSRRYADSPELQALAYLKDEGVYFVMERIVCPNCDGKGSYVNPAIDSHGIGADEFADDPEFADSYWRGDYDQTCDVCKGANVIEGLDAHQSDPEAVEMYDEYIRGYYEDRAVMDAERRMGA